MITVAFSVDYDRQIVSLHMDGHAGSAKYGQDIVCASASILCYTIAQNMKMMRSMGKLKYEPRIKLKEGKAIISARANDGCFEEMAHSFLVIQTGFQLLAHNYPEYVLLKMFGEE